MAHHPTPEQTSQAIAWVNARGIVRIMARRLADDPKTSVDWRRIASDAAELSNLAREECLRIERTGGV